MITALLNWGNNAKAKNKIDTFQKQIATAVATATAIAKYSLLSPRIKKQNFFHMLKTKQNKKKHQFAATLFFTSKFVPCNLILFILSQCSYCLSVNGHSCIINLKASVHPLFISVPIFFFPKQY